MIRETQLWIYFRHFVPTGRTGFNKSFDKVELLVWEKKYKPISIWRQSDVCSNIVNVATTSYGRRVLIGNDLLNRYLPYVNARQLFEFHKVINRDHFCDHRNMNVSIFSPYKLLTWSSIVKTNVPRRWRYQSSGTYWRRDVIDHVVVNIKPRNTNLMKV